MSRAPSKPASGQQRMVAIDTLLRSMPSRCNAGLGDNGDAEAPAKTGRAQWTITDLNTTGLVKKLWEPTTDARRLLLVP